MWRKGLRLEIVRHETKEKEGRGRKATPFKAAQWTENRQQSNTKKKRTKMINIASRHSTHCLAGRNNIVGNESEPFTHSTPHRHTAQHTRG